MKKEAAKKENQNWVKEREKEIMVYSKKKKKKMPQIKSALKRRMNWERIGRV